MPRRKKARRGQVDELSPSAGRKLTPRQHVRNARNYPIYECWINKGWNSPQELTQIIIARQQPDKRITFGVYLVDKGCLGLKNTFCNAGLSRGEYKRDVVGHIKRSEPMEKCSLELAHQIIYQAIDYAAQFGFKPQKDFRDSRHVLAPRGTYKEEVEIEFGMDGQPFFFAGPYDNVDAIIRKLERTAGAGNYHYIVPVGAPPPDFFDDDW